VATFDLDLVDLFVGQGRLGWEDAVRIIDIGLVGIASTMVTSIATASATAATAIATMVAVAVLSIHLEKLVGLKKRAKRIWVPA